MKYRRSERLVDLTYFLLAHSNTQIPLSFFSERYESAKSSISEDLTIVKKIFKRQKIGDIVTMAGTHGGVSFFPALNKAKQQEIIDNLANRLSDETRLLPGGYVYLSDLLGEPEVLRNVGKLIANKYRNLPIDVVMTIATKGISLAQATANFLNVPFVIVRRNSKITEGATVSVNYVSGSSGRVEKMELSKRSLKQQTKVLVVDDFCKGGGTIAGMKSLIEEFEAKLVGIVVFAEMKFLGEKAITNYDSLLYVKDVDVKMRTIKVVPGNFLTKRLK